MASWTAARPALLAPAVLALALLLPIPGATAQPHDHASSPGIAIAHDLPPDGRTFVGNVNHFAVIAHGDDNVPDFHQDIPWRVTLDGTTLVETTAASGHDYDGVNAFDIVFPAPGPYTVEALDGQGRAVAMFSGTVVPSPSPLQAGGVTLDWPRETPPTTGSETPFEFWVFDRLEDAPIPHSDCTFEVLRQGRLEFRTKTHTHEEKQAVGYTFPDVGTYTVRVLCFQAYPSPRATLFLPQVVEEEVEVLPAAGVDTRVVTSPAVLPPADMNAVVTAPAGDMTLVGTFDPYVQVGPDTLQHLNVLAVDAAGNTLQHVDFTATLDGPLGRIFSSDTLHEYDGIYELATRQAVPGVYTLRATAEGAGGSGEIAMSYLVVPRAVPLSAGLVDVTLDAAPVTGQASEWLLAAQATSGPFAHGELEVRLTAASSTVPFLQAKLHTHDDGRFPFTVALPTEEPYTLDVTPFPLTPDLVLPTATRFLVEPAPGTPLSSDAESPAGEEPGQEMPAAPATLLLAALGLAAVALRRRA